MEALQALLFFLDAFHMLVDMFIFPANYSIEM